MTDEERERAKEELRDIVLKSREGITNAQSFCCMFSEDMVKNPVPVVQLGMAMMLDKPIVILAPQDVDIPGNIQRVAVAIERYERDDMKSYEEAAKRLFRKMTQ